MLPLPSSLLALKRNVTRPLSRDKSDTLLLLGTCVLVLAPHAAHLPGWVVLAGCVILFWRAWVTFRGDRMPPRWLLLPLAVLSMGAVYLTHKTLLGREAGVSMLALLLTLKLLEMHAKRDLFVVLFLSFFLVLTSFFYSQSIGVALMTIAAVVAILTTQLSFQYTGVVPPLRQRLRLGATILALAAPLTLVLFLLFPRIQGPLWGLPSDAHAGRSGLSDTMAPGNISNLALSEEIAFRVKFTDSPPPQSQLYWRAVVLGRYDGRTWLPLQSAARNFPQGSVNLRGTPVRYQVTLEPNGRRWLFAMDLPQSIPQLTNNSAVLGPDMQLLARRPINERVRYDATSHVDYDLQPNENPFVLEQWLQLPAGLNPRTRAMAARLREQHNNNGEIVNAVLRLFRTEKFSYTLEPPLLGTHVVDEFLFETRAGFCEHYSAAFVMLMRAAGIPARVVTGYQGGQINPVDDFMTIRQSDAHAWAEVWLENRGWTRVDPTAAVAPDRIQMNLARAIPRPLLGGLISVDASRMAWLSKLQLFRQNWDAVSNAWNQWVLSYTPETQQNLMRSLGFAEANWRTMTALMFAVGAAVMAIIAIPLVRGRSRLDPIEAIYRSLCQQMARRGYPKAVHEGPRAYSQRLTAADTPLAPQTKAAVARFLNFYESVRYGTPAKASHRSVIFKLKSLLAECR
ncbi:MAG: protein-glutamine gamma-glutamyltransferase [Burkholderiales bacterium]